MDLCNLDEKELEVAQAAVNMFRENKLSQLIDALDPPTWQNTLGTYRSISYTRLFEIAHDVGYAYVVWGGRIYPTVAKSIDADRCIGVASEIL